MTRIKTIQKDYMVEMYTPRESANQNVAIVGERNAEDQAVPSVMKLVEKLTDEEVGEMIPEIDVDDTQCSEQIMDVPVAQIRQNRGSCHSIPRERIPERAIAQIVTHTKGWRRPSKILGLPQQVTTHRMQRLSQGKTQQ